MEALETLHQEITTKYNYKRDKPVIERNNYVVYDAIHIELNVAVTIKIIINPQPELLRYLKKLKDSKVENTIKIYQIFESTNALFVATQQVTFSNLKNALQRCRKLDDFDAVFISKVILNIHVELLRAGVNWFGTQEDIEFTDSGLKLSWNNSIPFETQNPFPLILSKISGKIQVLQQKILPFPKSKVIDDLINVSSLNASEISLNNNMKKKEKLLKKRGKDWVALKEYKNDFQYYEQIMYLGVHKQIGFVRIKMYNAGKIDQQLLNLNKTKNTFTKVIDSYEENGKTYIISEYSNDGSLYNYVNKLKNYSIALKQDQIQFFFFSLFEPLKLIQQSSIKSLCMLHIKNIYIQNGIPKIGEPIPMNQELISQLKQKADVPDFYHPDFKKNPSNKTNNFDTYSLGVLLYKLMFTQYPIFPKTKVHIPTTPVYNNRLKTTLQIFLNEGGLLKEIEKKIQVSEQVAKQVRLNKNKLLKQKQKSSRSTKILLQDQQDMIEHQNDIKMQQHTQANNQQQYEEQQTQQCCKLCCAQLQDPIKHKSLMLNSLQQSPYSSYRLCTKTVLVLILYIFLFYFFFIQNSFSMLSSIPQLQRMNVTISTINYQITVSSPDTFYKVFNITNRSLSSLISMGCYINNYVGSGDFTSTAQATTYQVYVIFGIIAMIIIIIFKVIQIVNFDIIHTLYNMSNLKSNFNMSNYLIFHFFLASLINNHFIYFNQVFQTQMPTCLGVAFSYKYGSTETYFTDKAAFLYIFTATILIHFIIVLLHTIMISKTDNIRYTRRFNPILLILPFLIAYTIVVRLGVIKNYFYPSLLSNISTYGDYFLNKDYISIIGIIPQILFIFELLLEWIVDWFYWFFFDKRRRMLIHDMSSAGILV